MAQPNLLGLSLGNVKLVSLLGRGAMGTVYQAEHTALHTPYAVKVLHPEYSNDAIVAERFRREAMMCSQLRHPNIVFVTDFGKHDDVGLYLVMEYLTGENLGVVLQEYPNGLPLWRSVHILQQLCSAFALAHDAGIIHRDLKPENIFVLQDKGDTDTIKVLDFGIARLTATEDGELTTQGQIMGTPEFMAPEQTTGSSAISNRTDIYALGILTYNLLTGRVPFSAHNPMELMAMHLMQSPPPLSLHRPELKGTRLDLLLQEMLAKRPEERPASTQEIQQRLQRALQELQEQGVEDAFDPTGRTASPPAPEVSQLNGLEQDNGLEQEAPGRIVVPQASGSERYEGSAMFALSGVLRQLQDSAGQEEPSTLSRLYQHLPALQNLPPDLFFLASWGAVMRDLVDTPLEGPVFAQALDHLAALMEGLLTVPQTSDEVVAIQHLLRQSVQELLQSTSQERHLPILSAFQHMTTHYLFPHDALPQWAQAQTSGTWKSLRDVLTTDIRDLFQRKR